ncbi:MAG: DUF2975 domain-containing protein [Clostridia bacterium]|nr:DUF2975 domain-containing protein [Clostridia bacterium]
MEEKKKIWDSGKSVSLTLVIAWLFAAALLICMIIAPFVIPNWFTFRYTDGDNEYKTLYSYAYVVIAAFYICCPAGICCIASLIKLLTNIKKDIVFVPANIKLLRILSWCCFFVTAVSFVSSFFYIPFAIVFASSGFLGLILRVVKNVMARATEIKNENDLTI